MHIPYPHFFAGFDQTDIIVDCFQVWTAAFLYELIAGILHIVEKINQLLTDLMIVGSPGVQEYPDSSIV